MPAMDLHANVSTKGSGSWMIALLDHMAAVDGIQIGIVTAYPGRENAQFSADGIDYFVIGQPANARNVDCFNNDLKKCSDIVRQWKPDIVHIHGTERFYGLLKSRNLINCPVVVSVQGLINPCSKWIRYFGEMSFLDILKTHRLRDIILRRGLLASYLSFKRRARQEEEIIKGNYNFLGRTDWDRHHLAAMNPKARYYHVDEMMRTNFLKIRWDIDNCKRHSIIFTNSGHPRRGTETLIEATGLLKKEFPDVELKIAGNISKTYGYGLSLMKKIKKMGLETSVSFLGYLDEKKMAAALSRSHVFTISSYIENSPNSLCEAMIIGMPCVASYVGGIPSLVDHKQDGLLFPLGDSSSLAGRIREIFINKPLAIKLGTAARLRAMERHAPKRIIDALSSTYHKIALNDSGPW